MFQEGFVMDLITSAKIMSDIILFEEEKPMHYLNINYNFRLLEYYANNVKKCKFLIIDLTLRYLILMKNNK
jgi:hypothetical protein